MTQRHPPGRTARADASINSATELCGCGPRRLSFQVDLGDEALEPAGRPPRLLAEQLHDRGDEDHPHDRGIDDDRAGQADADELEEDLGAQGEGGEDRLPL